MIKKILYPKSGRREMPARYKTTFRSLLNEVDWLVKDARKEKYEDRVLIHNICAIVTYRIMDRDRKTADVVRRLKRALNDLT